jgi:hypothetical protein
MATRVLSLTPDQLAWCQQTMPSFAKAYADVCRRDADVAANRAQFESAARAAQRRELFVVASGEPSQLPLQTKQAAAAN